MTHKEFTKQRDDLYKEIRALCLLYKFSDISCFDDDICAFYNRYKMSDMIIPVMQFIKYLICSEYDFIFYILGDRKKDKMINILCRDINTLNSLVDKLTELNVMSDVLNGTVLYNRYHDSRVVMYMMKDDNSFFSGTFDSSHLLEVSFFIDLNNKMNFTKKLDL